MLKKDKYNFQLMCDISLLLNKEYVLKKLLKKYLKKVIEQNHLAVMLEYNKTPKW